MGDEFAHGFLDLLVAIQRGFEEVHVERHAERGEVEILFAAQIGDGKATNRIEVIRIAGGGDGLTIHFDRCAVEIGLGDIGDVVAAIAVFRPAGVVGLQALGARLRRLRKILDLHAGIVVVELALHVPAVGVEHARDAVADGRGAAVADVQRAGGVGGHVFHAGGATAAAGVAAVGVALGVHPAQLALPGGGRQPEIQEARPGDLDRGDVVVDGQGVDQRLRNRARVAACGLC